MKTAKKCVFPNNGDMMSAMCGKCIDRARYTWPNDGAQNDWRHRWITGARAGGSEPLLRFKEHID